MRRPRPLPPTNCHYCGKFGEVTRDHVVPKSALGPDVLENIVPSCLPCNMEKRSRIYYGHCDFCINAIKKFGHSLHLADRD